jgi:alanine racemase
MTVVKADAYGHGLKAIAAHLMRSGTDVFGVANLAEARVIRGVGRGWPILMLGACLPEEVEPAVRDDVMPTISSLEEARAFSGAAVRLARPVRAHVKVDTGMGRLGVAAEDAVELVSAVGRLPGLLVEGIFTHYASAEDDARFTKVQRTRFEDVLRELRVCGIRVPITHASNSGALLRAAHSDFQLVRPGLLVYGVLPGNRRRIRSPLSIQTRAALALKCRVGYVKGIGQGAPLSYGRTFVAPRPMRVATLTAGYGDGYPRAASNRAQVLTRGRRCPVVGRVTMDQTLVDVSRVKGVAPGDEVVLIGRQGRGEITAMELAGWCGMVPWEILTGISYRAPRIYRGAQAS